MEPVETVGSVRDAMFEGQCRRCRHPIRPGQYIAQASGQPQRWAHVECDVEDLFWAARVDSLAAEVEALRTEKERLCADALAAEARADETITELRAAIERVRALHWPSEATVDLPAVCVECVKDWPCPTVRAGEA